MSSMTVSPGYAGVRTTRRPAPVRVEGPVRLTRRGRVLITVLFLGMLFAALTLLSGHSAASGEADGAGVETRTVVVEPGDTLWAIAAEVAEPGEVRDVVHQIEKLNALPGSALAVGQELAVPVR